jgi:hypothetical protein
MLGTSMSEMRIITRKPTAGYYPDILSPIQFKRSNTADIITVPRDVSPGATGAEWHAALYVAVRARCSAKVVAVKFCGAP